MVSILDKSKLTDKELLIFNQEVADRKKNPVIAYLLWWFTGFMGGHRYYFGKYGSAIAMTLIFWLLVWLFGLGLIITGIWALVDVFLISGWLKRDNEEVSKEVFDELMMKHQYMAANQAENVSSPAQQAAQPVEPNGDDEQESPADSTVTPRFCPNCGYQLDGSMTFCPECGTKIANS
ncbi:NINE protein [Limosilactobacillus agrestis]|uniref:NINE protein n=1 Tax=Limosilactobacillus agrestis TaxID=2759748 RepID=A0ABS8R682_9LACO|nr:NINE protein [Limosilactobacillus agrestis]MCD7130284.1 NINE protein [Limosilactobacillus agrestis]